MGLFFYVRMRAMNAIQAAESFLNVREHGKNRGTEIDAFNLYTGAAMGSPWCASFVSFCLFKAKAGDHGFKSASTLQIKQWAKTRSRLFKDPEELLKCHGALFGWTGPDGVHGHVGFVGQRYTDLDTGKVVAIGTVEGNTDGSGGRDGDGVYQRTRTLEEDEKDHDYWFVDLSGIPGCDYWK